MADESCCDHHDAKRLIDLEACDLLDNPAILTPPPVILTPSQG